MDAHMGAQSVTQEHERAHRGVSGRRMVVGTVALLGVATLALAGSALLAGDSARGGATELVFGGAAGQYGSISGITHIFWGEQKDMPGRYPKEYAQQLKTMRSLSKVSASRTRCPAAASEQPKPVAKQRGTSHMHSEARWPPFY
jgi:hypothetical protein